MDDLNNRTIKGYELRERIGAGGFGAVYRAYQPVIQREVAIKVILPEHANQPEFIKNFESEAQMVARLEHPYIVPLFDYWRDPDGAYLVLRWLRGGSLSDMLKQRGALDFETIAKILDNITSALSVAHRNGVVHRDIKPDNILLDEDGNAYLTDFGISKAVGQQATDESVSGSLMYMAPEQLMGQPPTPKADLYSLGLVIYEMVEGQHPFEGLAPSQLITSQIEDPLPDISDEYPVEINDIIQKTTAKDPGERFENVRQIAAAFRRAIAPETTVDVSAWEIDEADIVNPYKGLRAFQMADAQDFFGREALINHLVARMDEKHELHRFLAVVGPSGSGKSSAVHAGLVPALWDDAVDQSGDWFTIDMTPGTHPLRQLEAALLSIAAEPPSDLYKMLKADSNGLIWAADRIMGGIKTDLLLIVDQFEELFTLTEDNEERTHFLDLLQTAVTAPDSRLRIIITLRADFTDKPLEYVEFGELLRHRTEFVLPLSIEEIERAISGPANRVGLQVDTDLVAAIVADVRDEPGALPLLQYALTEVYERREGRRLTLEGYRQSGGVLGALARRAEEIFQTLDVQQQNASRQVFLRLISLGEGTEDTRRRAGRTELASAVADATVLQSVLDDFGKYRLLAFDSEMGTREPTVEVAHEALIREWDRLRGWLDNSRDDIRLQRMLAAAAQEWQNSRDDTSYLLSGARLVQFEEWSTTTDIALTEVESKYIKVSVDQRLHEAEQERVRQAHELELERRSRNRMRMIAVVLAVGVVVAGLLSVFAFSQSSVAQSERDNAVAAQGTSQSRGTEVAQQVDVAQAAQGTAVYEANNALTQEGIAQINAQEAIDNASTAQSRGTEVAQQVDIAQAAQATSDINAQIAIENASTATIAQGDAQFQAETAVAAQATSGANAEAALNSAATATIAQGDAQFQAETAVAAQATSGANAEAAFNSAATATIAQGDAQFQAETAVAAQATSGANAESALNNAATATIAQGDALFQAETAVAAQSTSDSNAAAALNSAATATIAQGDALFQAETAVAAQATSGANAEAALNNAATAQARGTEVAEQVVIAQAAQGTAVYEADNAATQEGIANENAQLAADNAETSEANAGRASTQEAIAVNALATSEASGREARAQNLASIADQLLDVGNTELALPLALEAANLNPDLIQAQSVLNQITDVSPVLAVGNVQIGYSSKFSIASDNQVLGLRDRETGEFSETAYEVTVENDNAVFSPDSRYLATANTDNNVYLWEIETRNLIHRLSGHLDDINQLIFTPDGRYLITASNDLSAVIWDVETGQEVHRLVGHDEPIVALAVSADSALVATGGDLPGIIMWDIDTGEALWRSQTNTSTTKLRFSNDGRVIYSWFATDYKNSGQRAFEKYNVNTGQRVSFSEDPFYRGLNRDGTVAWAGGIRTLQTQSNVIGSPNRGNLAIWDPSTESKVREYISGFDWRIDSILFLDFSPDGSKLLVGVESFTDSMVQTDQLRIGVEGNIKKKLVYLDSASNTVLNQYEGNSLPERITSAVFLADNRTVLSTTEDNQLIMWDVETGATIRQVGVNDLGLKFVGLSADEHYALTYSPDGTVHVWDISINNQNEVRRIALEDIGDIAFSPDEQEIYAQAGSELKVIERSTGREIRSVYPGNAINSVDFSPSEPRALASILIHWVEDRQLRSYNCVAGEYNTIVDNCDAYGGYVGGRDSRIHNTGGQLVEVNLDTGEILRTVGSLQNSIHTAIYNETGTEALVDFTLKDLNTWQTTQVIKPEPLRDVTINIESYNLTWGDDLWETRSNLQQADIVGDQMAIQLVLDAAIHDDIAVILSYYIINQFPESGALRVIDDYGINQINQARSPVVEAGSRISLMSLSTGEELRVFSGFSSIPTNIALSPDGTLLLISLTEPENTVLLLDVASGELIRRFVGHTRTINDVTFSPDGLTALSASDDRTVIMWDVSTGQIIQQFTGHNDGVNYVVFSKDGRSALSTDGTEIIEWRIESLEDILTRVHETRFIYQLNCIQRVQYNVHPFCDEANSTSTPTPTPTIEPTSFLRVEIVVDNATVRSGAGSGFEVVASLPRGTVVDILEIQTEWFKIVLPDGGDGWVSRQLAVRQ
jgi:WD40 repeat protein